MPRFIDLTGKVFGQLTVLSIVGNIGSRAKWLCHCSCGNDVVVFGLAIKYGNTKSCGCGQHRHKDLVGKVFGRWTVIKYVGHNKLRHLTWLCRCECGTERVCAGNNLKSGATKSCGCFRISSAKKRGPRSQNWKGGKPRHMQGYVYIYKPDHPNVHKKGGFVAEHIYVMSQMIGRQLTKDETVHHKNGVKDDNSPSNLELWASRHPKGQRVSDLIIFAKEILLKYEEIN